MTYNTSIILLLNIIFLGKKVSQNANFKIFECSGEVDQISHVIYETTTHFSFKVLIDLQYNYA